MKRSDATQDESEQRGKRRIRVTSLEKRLVQMREREREREEKNTTFCIYIYDDDAFYERVVVRVVVDGVAVVAKEYSREDGDFIVVEIIVRCEETR